MKITHDLHIHTDLSINSAKEATLEMYVKKAKECGLNKIAITDHMWDHTIDGWQGKAGNYYELQDYPHICKIKDEISALTGKELKIFFGAESEYCYENHCPAISPKVAEQLDVLLVPNSHTHLTMPKSFYDPPQKHIEYMVNAFMDIISSDVARYITAIPHPFMALYCPYSDSELLAQITDDQFKSCFTAAAEKGIALEINLNFLKDKTLAEAYENPAFRMYKIGKECGCKFTVGSDAHSEAELDNFKNVYIFTALLELKEEDIHPTAR